MIAGILFSKKQVHKYLKECGFTLTRKVYQLESGKYRIWKTTWGTQFSVRDDDFSCAAWAIEDLVESISSTKP